MIRLAGSQMPLMAVSQNARVSALARDSASANDPRILDESASDRDVRQTSTDAFVCSWQLHDTCHNT
ncbi:hypothetical protein ROHU_018234 [Labeo rohita]|uniref:Uncharacterized protein n=1 Tax=Labeo rohita TaxID=84645 RepID=A0A498N696_LABRO|nr:hypothetical protein ROHU_018234 [Labeo rohita]